MPYDEVADEIGRLWGVTISKSGVRDVTMRNSRVCEEVDQQESQYHLTHQPEVEASAEQMTVSVDGSFIHLCSGEWREVKLLTIGINEKGWNHKKQRQNIQTTQVSYHARMESADKFAVNTIGEWQRRGCEKAKTIVAVNDGATWIQTFIDYHAPKAVRILDFAHACGYLTPIAHVLYGQEGEQTKKWLGHARHQLMHHPPAKTLNALALLQRQHHNSDKEAPIATALAYLQRRREQIDYPHFRRCGYPIGSGTVESGHKVVIQRRMKQAGMRWHPDSVNPMLALRSTICNHRWDEKWDAIVKRRRAKKWERRLENYRPAPKPSPPPLKFSSIHVEESIEKSPQPSKDYKPAPDHPWRRDIWPERRFA